MTERDKLCRFLKYSSPTFPGPSIARILFTILEYNSIHDCCTYDDLTCCCKLLIDFMMKYVDKLLCTYLHDNINCPEENHKFYHSNLLINECDAVYDSYCSEMTMKKARTMVWSCATRWYENVTPILSYTLH